MFLLTEKTMAGGRPKSEDGDQTTRQVRVFVDIADMVGWIHYFEHEKSGENVAQIIDPMIRDAVVKRYMEYRKRAEAMAKAEGQKLQPGEVPRSPRK